MILVTGAAGQFGTAAITALKRSTDQVVGFVRDPAKGAHLGIELRVGDYDDPASIERAMQGIEKVLLVAGTDEHKRVRQHENVIAAAKQAGVACLAYTSRTLKDRGTIANQLMQGHFLTEDAIHASGIPHQIFRNVLYMDVLPHFVGDFKRGITVPAGDGKVSYALRSELAEAIANALVGDTRTSKTHFLTNAHSYSFSDIAAVLSELSGTSVSYTPADPVAFAAQLEARGVPAVAATRVVGFLTDIAHGQEDLVTSELATLLGRPPTSLRDGLKILFKL